MEQVEWLPSIVRQVYEHLEGLRGVFLRARASESELFLEVDPKSALGSLLACFPPRPVERWTDQFAEVPMAFGLSVEGAALSEHVEALGRGSDGLPSLWQAAHAVGGQLQSVLPVAASLWLENDATLPADEVTAQLQPLWKLLASFDLGDEPPEWKPVEAQRETGLEVYRATGPMATRLALALGEGRTWLGGGPSALRQAARLLEPAAGADRWKGMFRELGPDASLLFGMWSPASIFAVAQARSSSLHLRAGHGD
jgi:hypothetical protein